MLRNRKFRSYSLLAILSFIGLTSLVVRQFGQSDMLRLQFANPQADLQLALKRQDFRFVGLGGFVGTVPDNLLVYKLSEIKGVKFIEGTGDDGHRDIFYSYLIGGVRRYAAKYNNLLAFHILRSQDSSPGIRRLRHQQKQ